MLTKENNLCKLRSPASAHPIPLLTTRDPPSKHMTGIVETEAGAEREYVLEACILFEENSRPLDEIFVRVLKGCLSCRKKISNT